MNHIKLLAFSALLAACDSDTLNVGQSLTENVDKLALQDTVYYAHSQTVLVDSVLSLTNTCWLGRVMDPQTQSVVQTDFTTQFHPVELFYLPPADSIASTWADPDTTPPTAIEAADSCDLVLYLNAPLNPADSLVAMKLRVKELATPVEEGRRYYTNYDPVALGMLRNDEGAIDVEKMFTYKDQTVEAAHRDSSGYQDIIHVTLNQPYTDRNGRTYSNYGTYLMQQYYSKPDNFRNSWRFSHYVCPGLFVELTDGLGFQAQVTNMGLRVFFRRYNEGKTSQRASSFVLAGTHEVLQTTRVTNDRERLRQLAEQERGWTYLKSPAGLMTEVTLPVEEIKAGHDNDSLVAARIDFQRMNFGTSLDRQFGAPTSLLMVLEDEMDRFFLNNLLPDNQTSYLATFSSQTNVYTYPNISNLVTQIWNRRQEGLRNDPQWVEKHPKWNKVLLVPVNTIYNTSGSTSTLVAVEHAMGLSCTRLAGGPEGSGIGISVVYAKFSN